MPMRSDSDCLPHECAFHRGRVRPLGRRAACPPNSELTTAVARNCVYSLHKKAALGLTIRSALRVILRQRGRESRDPV
jgi:hypothetical protein